MDAFKIIQHFFSRMHCQHCDVTFEPDDIELIRKEDSMYVVNVFCHRCQTQNGVALVGVDVAASDNANHDDDALFDMGDDDLQSHQDFIEAMKAVGFGQQFTRALESVPGKMVVPEDVFMQMLEQSGAFKGGLGRSSKKRHRFIDPELTQKEIERLSDFAPIDSDAVIDAHHFIQGLEQDWMKFIPEEMRPLQTAPHTESQAE